MILDFCAGGSRSIYNFFGKLVLLLLLSYKEDDDEGRNYKIEANCNGNADLFRNVLCMEIRVSSD